MHERQKVHLHITRWSLQGQIFKYHFQITPTYRFYLLRGCASSEYRFLSIFKSFVTHSIYPTHLSLSLSEGECSIISVLVSLLSYMHWISTAYLWISIVHKLICLSICVLPSYNTKYFVAKISFQNRKNANKSKTLWLLQLYTLSIYKECMLISKKRKCMLILIDTND